MSRVARRKEGGLLKIAYQRVLLAPFSPYAFKARWHNTFVESLSLFDPMDEFVYIRDKVVKSALSDQEGAIWTNYSPGMLGRGTGDG